MYSVYPADIGTCPRAAICTGTITGSQPGKTAASYRYTTWLGG
jgi:hypothetical protein